jgi:hypothetical protein
MKEQVVALEELLSRLALELVIILVDSNIIHERNTTKYAKSWACCS